METLFAIAFLSFIILAPWGIPSLFSWSLKITLLIIAAAVAVFFGSWALFEGLKRGKLSIVEPISSMELPIALLITTFWLKEVLPWYAIVLILLAFIGVWLIVSDEVAFWKKWSWHTSIVLAGISALGMAISNVLYGRIGSFLSPLAVIWAVHGLTAIFCAIWLTAHGRWQLFMRGYRAAPVLLFFSWDFGYDGLGLFCVGSLLDPHWSCGWTHGALCGDHGDSWGMD
jgi:drug/metabolite transporter (DMT)-like permease